MYTDSSVESGLTMADAEQKKQCDEGGCCNGHCMCTKDTRNEECKSTTPSCCAVAAFPSVCTEACQSGYKCITGDCKCSSTCECPKCKSCCGGKEKPVKRT